MPGPETEPKLPSPENPNINDALKNLVEAFGGNFKCNKEKGIFICKFTIQGSRYEITYNPTEETLSIETPSKAETPNHIDNLLDSLTEEPKKEVGATTSWKITEDALIKAKNLFKKPKEEEIEGPEAEE
jgi:hypothetical protein